MQVMAKDVSSRISPRGSVETKEIAALEVLYSPKFPKHGGFWNRYFQFFISSHLMSEVQAVCLSWTLLKLLTRAKIIFHWQVLNHRHRLTAASDFASLRKGRCF